MWLCVRNTRLLDWFQSLQNQMATVEKLFNRLYKAKTSSVEIAFEFVNRQNFILKVCNSLPTFKLGEEVVISSGLLHFRGIFSSVVQNFEFSSTEPTYRENVPGQKNLQSSTEPRPESQLQHSCELKWFAKFVGEIWILYSNVSREHRRSDNRWKQHVYPARRPTTNWRFKRQRGATVTRGDMPNYSPLTDARPANGTRCLPVLSTLPRCQTLIMFPSFLDLELKILCIM